MPFPPQAPPTRPGSRPGQSLFRPDDPASCVPEPPREPDGKTGRGRLTIINGIVRDCRVKQMIMPKLDHGPLNVIHAIVVHQTASSTATSTLSQYRNVDDGNGAHFLLDKDGTIYQTMSLIRKCQHVGKLQARCLLTHTCTKDEEKKYKALGPVSGRYAREVNASEQPKSYPDRYPANADSIGIEIVGRALGTPEKPSPLYEPPTPEEQRSLQWLVTGLLDSLHLTQTDVYRHPQVSYKLRGEALDADWTGSGSATTKP